MVEKREMILPLIRVLGEMPHLCCSVPGTRSALETRGSSGKEGVLEWHGRVGGGRDSLPV
jgi:hypothetical protein